MLNLVGNGFAQTIRGNAGANSLNGGMGNDTLQGGTGTDVFVFSTALGSSNIDVISDYSVIDDQITLDDIVFTGLARRGLAATAFTANETGLATNASHRIIYETDTGHLYFDADGSGSGAAVQRVASGTYDMGFADMASLMEFHANNPDAPNKPVAVMVVYNNTPAAVMALKKSGIQTAADLSGKKMGAPVFDAGRKAFPTFAKANQVS